MQSNAQDDTDSVNKAIWEPYEKRFKLIGSDSDSEEVVENTSDEVQLYKMDKKICWICWSTTMMET